MLIDKMRDEHLSTVSEVDNQAFKRIVPRAIENLKVLKSSDPDGSHESDRWIFKPWIG